MRRTLLLTVSLLLAIASCSDAGGGGTIVLQPNESGDEVPAEAPSDAVPAPEFPDGLDWLNVPRPLSLAELRGKAVLLDFWTYGCINCIHIIPDLKRLEAEYPDELVVIGVHSAKFENEGDTDNIRNIIARYDIAHPVVNDKDFVVWSQWGVQAWPSLVLIDPQGGIVGGHAGEGIYEVFQPAIESVVEEFDDLGLIDRSPIDLDRELPPSTVLSFPGKVTVDEASRSLFVADTNHHRIVIADLDTGEVIDVAGNGSRGFVDGFFADASFDQPQGMAVSADGALLYVADLGNHAIRVLDLSARTVETLVGTGDQARLYPPAAGQAPNVELASPWDVLLEGDRLYIAMAGSHQIWVMDLRTGEVAAFAGSGREGTGEAPRSSASLAQPSGLATDGAGRVFFADSESSSIRYADEGADGSVGLVAGAATGLFDFGLLDGVGEEARFQHPLGVVYIDGDLFVADTYNSAVRRIDLATGAVTTIAGGSGGWADGLDPRFDEPGGIDYADGLLFLADANNHVIRTLDPATGEASTLVLFGIERFSLEGVEAETVVFDSVVVSPGDLLVELEVTLPSGYVLNDLAPFAVEVSADGLTGSLGEGVRDVEPAFPVEFAVAIEGGEGSLFLDVTTYFCTAEAKDLCLIDQVRLEIPLAIDPDGVASVAAEYSVPSP